MLLPTPYTCRKPATPDLDCAVGSSQHTFDWFFYSSGAYYQNSLTISIELRLELSIILNKVESLQHEL